MESGDLEYAAVSGNRFTPERLKGMTESPGKNARERCQEPQSAGRANGSDPDSQRNAGQGKEDNSQEQYCTQGDVREAGGGGKDESMQSCQIAGANHGDTEQVQAKRTTAECNIVLSGFQRGMAEAHENR